MVSFQVAGITLITSRAGLDKIFSGFAAYVNIGALSIAALAIWWDHVVFLLRSPNNITVYSAGPARNLVKGIVVSCVARSVMLRASMPFTASLVSSFGQVRN